MSGYILISIAYDRDIKRFAYLANKIWQISSKSDLLKI